MGCDDRHELRSLRALVDELYTCCLTSVGAYDALKVAGMDTMLPGYEHCLQQLQHVIESYEQMRHGEEQSRPEAQMICHTITAWQPQVTHARHGFPDCVATRPMAVCPCGTYRLNWELSDDAMTPPVFDLRDVIEVE